MIRQILQSRVPSFSKSHELDKIATMTNDHPHGIETEKSKAVFDQVKRRDFLRMVGGAGALILFKAL